MVVLRVLEKQQVDLNGHTMSETEIKEIKIVAANRVPVGDRWQCVLGSTNTELIWESLTDCLEHIFQKTGKTQFYMDAREGKVYIIDTEERIIPPKEPKNYSLYGDR